MYCTSKIVVFDLDETLGYYVEFGMFWDALKEFIKIHNIPIIIDQSLFNKALDLFPEFLRPNIINILNYLKQKKNAKHCHKLMIYTNNQGPDEWAQQIQSYFETKVKSKLFDQIIKAFKIRGKQVEICRTSHMKNHEDLIRCTKIPETTEICFLDDVYHPGMVDDRVYYINLKPYVYDLPFDIMIDRFIKSNIIDLNQHVNTSEENDFTQYMMTYMKRYRHDYVEKTKEAQNVDKILSKKILQHLQTFFNKGTNANTTTNANTNANTNKKTRNRKPLKQKNRTIKNKMIKKIQSV
jgi:hypothetical protein